MNRAASVFVLILLIFNLISKATTVQHKEEPTTMKLSSELSRSYSFGNVTTHEGDLIVGNTSELLIENCLFNITGKLIISGEARVVVRNTLFISYWNVSEQPDYSSAGNPWRTRHIIVKNNAKLRVFNCDFMFYRRIAESVRCSILLFDQADVNITSASFIHKEGDGEGIFLYNASRLHMDKVSMSTYEGTSFWDRIYYPKSGVWIFGEAEIQAQNSDIDVISFIGNSTSAFHSIVVEFFRTSRDAYSKISVFDSEIDNLWTYGSHSSIWLENCTVNDLVAERNAKVWLYNSFEQNDHLPSKGEVFVVWDIPLLGQLSIPCIWAPYIIPVIVAIPITSVVLLIAFKLLNSRRKPIVDAT